MRTSRAADCRSAAHWSSKPMLEQWSRTSDGFGPHQSHHSAMVSAGLSTSAAKPLPFGRHGYLHHCSSCAHLRSDGDPKSRPEFGRIMLPAEVAQLVEQWSEEPCVAGSSPALGTEGFAGISVIGRFKQRPSTLRPFLGFLRVAYGSLVTRIANHLPTRRADTF